MKRRNTFYESVSSMLIKRILIRAFWVLLILSSSVLAEYKKAIDTTRDSITAITNVKKSQAGDADSQLEQAFHYFNYKKKYQNQNSSIYGDVSHTDEKLGQYWLMHAIKSYEKSGSLDTDTLTGQVCQYLRFISKKQNSQLKQAYLWALIGMHERSSPSKSRICIRDMHDSGQLKAISPKLDHAWTKRFQGSSAEYNEIIYRTKPHPLPDLLIKARNALAEQELPIFSYYFSEERIEIQLYKDGTVYIKPDGKLIDEKRYLKKLKANELKAFFKDLTLTGFYEWTMEDMEMFICDKGCKTTRMKLVSRVDGQVYRRYIEEVYIPDFAGDEVTKYDMTSTEVVVRKKNIAKFKTRKTFKYISKMKTLMDHHFSTTQLSSHRAY